MINPVIASKLQQVRERIAGAALRSGRDPAEIELVAVSKTYPPELIWEASESGQEIFGESRIQEAILKIPLLPARLRWHFIGHLQSNKVRKILPLFELIHGVDKLGTARDIDRIGAELGLFPRVLLEVNVSGEGSKQGFEPQNLEAIIGDLLTMPRLQVEGLMTMAPLSPEAEFSRRYFSGLRELRDRLAKQTGIPLSALSMGMSGDFEVAVEEGATLCRVGSAIFG
jgi:pyridoxal phosphate enzyme (YggS family)